MIKDPSGPTATRPKTSNIAPFGLRMQPDLREKLESAATRNGRSMNAEIVARLERSLDEDTQTQPKTILIEDLENLLHGVLDRIGDKKKP